MGIIDVSKEFGALIRARRKALGLTQRDLALAINVGERFIVELENGKPTSQLGKALAVAMALGIKLSSNEDGNRSRIATGNAYPDLPDIEVGA